MSTSSSHPPAGPSPIPIVEEQAHVHRETVETGAVRVRVQARHRTEVIDAPVSRHGLRVDRIERNVVVESRREPWYEDDVMVVPVYEEVLVKQLVLKEELRLAPTAEVRHEALQVDLVSEVPVFERRDAQGTWQEIPADGLSGPPR